MSRAKPQAIHPDISVSATNPHSWLSLIGDEAGASARCMVGTLRPEHRGYANSAASFAAAKLLIDMADGGAPWRPRAYRHEVLLPRDADDRFACPKTLFESVDEAHPAGGKALVGYITLTWTPTRLHKQWSLARHLAAGLVAEHDVPALIVQHVPGLVASRSTPHCHILLAGPRMLTAIGWGGYVTALTGDRIWAMVKERFERALAAS